MNTACQAATTIPDAIITCTAIICGMLILALLILKD